MRESQSALKSRRRPTLAMASLVFLLPALPAWAYLDPGTGSYAFQILLAGLMAGLFALKAFWRRIRDLLRSFGTRRKVDPP